MEENEENEKDDTTVSETNKPKEEAVDIKVMLIFSSFLFILYIFDGLKIPSILIN